MKKNCMKCNFMNFITEAPKIDTSVDEYHVNNGSSVDLSCRYEKNTFIIFPFKITQQYS